MVSLNSKNALDKTRALMRPSIPTLKGQNALVHCEVPRRNLAWQLALVLLFLNVCGAAFLGLYTRPHWITGLLLLVANLFVLLRAVPDLKSGLFISIYEDRIKFDNGEGERSVRLCEIKRVVSSAGVPGGYSTLELLSGTEVRIAGPDKHFTEAWRWFYDHLPTNLSARP